MGGIDEAINGVFDPLARWLGRIVFYSIDLDGAELPLIVVWLVAGAFWFTVRLGFINLRGFRHALRVVSGREDPEAGPGEVSHFQALTTAVSGTVGVGNVTHVAVAISVGGPGATFWLIVAGFLGMASKFVECSLAVKHRQQNPDGSVSGGPMFYIERGLGELGWPRLGRWLARYYAVCIMIGCVGIGGMFQANQAYVQFVNVTGGPESFVADRGWLFGLAIALLTALVIIGGIKSIARVTSKLVPLMAFIYVTTAFVVIGMNVEKLPAAFRMIVVGAFSPEGVAGGVLSVLILGFRRAAFSNEAGIGSSAIAHAAVRTEEPITQGFVAMLEPFIDTIVICSLTALVITLTVYEPGMVEDGAISGVELTSSAFASALPWFPTVLAVVVMLFAYSTMISWSYYGLTGWVYLFGAERWRRHVFNAFFCACLVVGCTAQLDAVLDFSDALVFAMAFANVLALYVLAPGVKRDLDAYWAKVRSRSDQEAVADRR